jgi:hypothetical protein
MNLRSLLGEPVKGFLRTTRNGGPGAGIGYLRAPRISRLFPSITRRYPLEDFEIHILTGRSRLTMALWMVATWMATTERNWKFVIHDDGSLREADALELKRLLPECRVLLSAETNPIVSSALARHPLCLQCRNLHPLGRKLIDMPLFSQGLRLVSIDTDILFYRKPERLMRWLRESNPPSIFMEDVKDACLLDRAQVKELFGALLVEKINTGIIAVSKEILALDLLEDCLARTGLLSRKRWFIEQTLYAVAASVAGATELLPQEYEISLTEKCSPDAVARHYVGAIRHLFYSEGLARASALLGRAPRSS